MIMSVLNDSLQTGQLSGAHFSWWQNSCAREKARLAKIRITIAVPATPFIILVFSISPSSIRDWLDIFYFLHLFEYPV